MLTIETIKKIRLLKFTEWPDWNFILNSGPMLSWVWCLGSLESNVAHRSEWNECKANPESQSFHHKNWSGLPQQISLGSAYVGHRHPFNTHQGYLIRADKADQKKNKKQANSSRRETNLRPTAWTQSIRDTIRMRGGASKEIKSKGTAQGLRRRDNVHSPSSNTHIPLYIPPPSSSLPDRWMHFWRGVLGNF